MLPLLVIGGVIGAVMSAAKGASWLSDQLDSTKTTASAGGKPATTPATAAKMSQFAATLAAQVAGQSVPVSAQTTAADVPLQPTCAPTMIRRRGSRRASWPTAISANTGHIIQSRLTAPPTTVRRPEPSQSDALRCATVSMGNITPTPTPQRWIASTTNMLWSAQPAATGCPLRGNTTNHRTRLAITPSIKPESQDGSASFGRTSP